LGIEELAIPDVGELRSSTSFLAGESLSGFEERGIRFRYVVLGEVGKIAKSVGHRAI